MAAQTGLQRRITSLVFEVLPVSGIRQPGLTIVEISQATGLPKDRVRRALAAMVKAKLATYRRAKGGYRYWRRFDAWLEELLGNR